MHAISFPQLLFQFQMRIELYPVFLSERAASVQDTSKLRRFVITHLLMLQYERLDSWFEKDVVVSQNDGKKRQRGLIVNEGFPNVIL